MRLETPRLIIRSWHERDVDAYAAIVADPEVMRFIGNGRVHDHAEAQAFVQRGIEVERERPWLLWAVEHAVDRRLIGFCGFAPYGTEVEIGWRLASAYWRRGLGTEAARAVLRYGLDDLGLPHVVSVAQTENVASIRIMNRIGLRYRETTIDDSCGREVVVFESGEPERYGTIAPEADR